MSDFDDILSALSGRRSQYSSDEIDQALAKAKKTGGNLMDSLQELTGRRLTIPDSLMGGQTSLQTTAEAAAAEGQLDALDSSLLQSAAEDQTALDRQLAELNRSLARDFGGMAEQTMPRPQATAVRQGTAEDFDGVWQAVGETVFGQEKFLKKLAVAFKRPYILPEEKKHARNCFYVSGAEDTGRHLALTEMAEELYKRQLLSSGEVLYMDLSVYPDAGKDHVFLQDLYTALRAEARVIVFENFEACHISCLTYLRDLVMKGECRLQERYTLQKGQLVNVSGSFAAETVSTFTAEGKYLVFMGTKGVDALAAVLGGPFVDALGDICETAALTEESYRRIAEVRWAAFKQTATQRLGFLTEGDEAPILETAVAEAGHSAGTAGLIAFFDKLLKSLATLKLEGCYENGTTVLLTVEDRCLYATLDNEKTDLMANLPAAYSGELEAVRQELAQIVGLTKVKEYILSLEEYYGTQKRRREAGLKASEVSKHMIFTGNPGTGKTTIARVVSRYLKAIGVLSGGQLVEVSRADLVGRYVGHTAPLVNQVLKSAIGGVLFIDEAYSLYRGREDSFGLEAIDTLVKGIEDNRDDLVVILAGYSNEMEKFLEANSGLKSRFPNFIHFPDYTGAELLEITRITARSKGYVLDEGAVDALLAYYNCVQALRPDTAGNGRLVRNKVEEAILNQSRRLAGEPEADLSLLQSRDFDLSDMNGEAVQTEDM